MQAQCAEQQLQHKILRETAKLAHVGTQREECLHNLTMQRNRAREERKMLEEEKKVCSPAFLVGHTIPVIYHTPSLFCTSLHVLWHTPYSTLYIITCSLAHTLTLLCTSSHALWHTPSLYSVHHHMLSGTYLTHTAISLSLLSLSTHTPHILPSHTGIPA